MAQLSCITRVFSFLPRPITSFGIKPPCNPFRSQSLLSYHVTKTRYPFDYDMIVTLPPEPEPRRPKQPIKPQTCFDNWVDDQLTSESSSSAQNQDPNQAQNRPNLSANEMTKPMRKYYNKRRKRMYGADSDDLRHRKSKYVVLKREVVKFRTLEEHEEELYFYDALAYPWEQDKHYKMVYQLEKKYFPGQGFDRAFLKPGESNKEEKTPVEAETVDDETRDPKSLVFFDEVKGRKDDKDVEMDVSQKKVQDFFKSLKHVPSEIVEEEPFFSSKSSGLPPKWDDPYGTVLLVNKPKGWTSFTVCGKLRRLVNVRKVGHAGTLDPMATGLLIVCIGKATKVVDKYQGMFKSYSGVFRLGEATSTLDAESPVIQREAWEHIKDKDIKKIAESFIGEIWQVPPMFSAIKVGGERLYDKARRGENLELAPRKISIFKFAVERSLEDRQNLVFRVTCSKGTYIRSLCSDFAKALKSCAHMTALRRDSIGKYSADDAWEFKELEEEIPKNYI